MFFSGVANYVTESWQNSANTNVIIVTDGGVGYGKKSLKYFLENKLLLDREIQLPLLFPGTLNIILVNHLEEVQNDVSSYEKLIELSGLPGQVLVPTGQFGYGILTNDGSKLVSFLPKFNLCTQCHRREVPRWEIFMEQELRFGQVGITEKKHLGRL